MQNELEFPFDEFEKLHEGMQQLLVEIERLSTKYDAVSAKIADFQIEMRALERAHLDMLKRHLQDAQDLRERIRGDRTDIDKLISWLEKEIKENS